jgi:hypothetical protein
MAHSSCGGQDCSLVPIPVPSLREVAQLSSRSGFTCARLESGHVRCWGIGPFGDGMLHAGPSNVPVEVAGIDDAVDLSVTPTAGCVLRSNCEIWCWGDNSVFELGDGTQIEHLAPAPATVF